MTLKFKGKIFLCLQNTYFIPKKKIDKYCVSGVSGQNKFFNLIILIFFLTLMADVTCVYSYLIQKTLQTLQN